MCNGVSPVNLTRKERAQSVNYRALKKSVSNGPSV